MQSLLCAIQFLQILTSLSSFPLGLCMSELQGCVCSDPPALCHHAGMCTAFIAAFIAAFIVVVLAFLPPCCVLSWLGWNRSPEQKQPRELRVWGFVQQVFVELFVKAGLKIVKCHSSELQHLSDAAVRMELRLCLWSWKLAVKLDPMCCWLLTVLSILALTQTGWFGDRTAGDVVSPRGSSSRAVLGTSRRALTSRGGCAHQAVEWPKAFVLCGALPALPIHFLSLMAEDVHLNICSLLKWVGFVPFKRNLVSSL